MANDELVPVEPERRRIALDEQAVGDEALDDARLEEVAEERRALAAQRPVQPTVPAEEPAVAVAERVRMELDLVVRDPRHAHLRTASARRASRPSSRLARRRKGRSARYQAADSSSRQKSGIIREPAYERRRAQSSW